MLHLQQFCPRRFSKHRDSIKVLLFFFFVLLRLKQRANLLSNKHNLLCQQFLYGALLRDAERNIFFIFFSFRFLPSLFVFVFFYILRNHLHCNSSSCWSLLTSIFSLLSYTRMLRARRGDQPIQCFFFNFFSNRQIHVHF